VKGGLLALAAVAALFASGCAGARLGIRADAARYPVSFSGAVRDSSGLIYNRHSLTTVARFRAERTPVGVLYSSWTFPSAFDISEEVNRQVALSCGEAVVNLTISVSNACTALNLFPVLNALPSWPGCVPVTVTGDIVRRREAGCPTAARP
jgi:hypothetical protein